MATRAVTTLSALALASTSTSVAVSSTISFDHPVNKVDVFASGSYGTGAGVVSAEFSVDGGTTWYPVQNDANAKGDTGHIMSFICYGQKLRFKLTDGSSSATDSTLVLQVLSKAVSQSEVKYGDIGTTSGATYDLKLGKAPDQVCLVCQAGTWDTLDVYLDGSPDGGTTWYQMGSYGKMEENEFQIVDNPAEFTNFRIRTANQDSGTTAAKYWLIAANYGPEVRKVKDPRPANYTAAVGTGSSAATTGAVIVPATLQADLAKVWKALEQGGLLPTRQGAVDL